MRQGLSSVKCTILGGRPSVVTQLLLGPTSRRCAGKFHSGGRVILLCLKYQSCRHRREASSAQGAGWQVGGGGRAHVPGSPALHGPAQNAGACPPPAAAACGPRSWGRGASGTRRPASCPGCCTCAPAACEQLTTPCETAAGLRHMQARLRCVRAMSSVAANSVGSSKAGLRSPAMAVSASTHRSAS